MLGLGSIGYVQSFQYVLINIEPIRPSDYSQFVFLALCVFDFDIPALDGFVGLYYTITAFTRQFHRYKFDSYVKIHSSVSSGSNSTVL